MDFFGLSKQMQAYYLNSATTTSMKILPRSSCHPMQYSLDTEAVVNSLKKRGIWQSQYDFNNKEQNKIWADYELVKIVGKIPFRRGLF